MATFAETAILNALVRVTDDPADLEAVVSDSGSVAVQCELLSNI